MGLFFYDFSRIRFTRSSGDALVRRQRVSMEDMDGSDDGETIRLYSRPSAVAQVLTTELGGRTGLADGEVVTTAGFASATDRSGARFRFHAGVSGGQVNGSDYSRIDCPNGQYRMLFERDQLNASAFGAGLGLGLDSDRLRASCLTMASTGGVVQLPPGTFTLTNSSLGKLLLGANVTLRGAGMYATKLVLPGSWSPAVHCQSNTGCVIEDLTIELQTFADFISAIDASGTNHCTVRRCRIYMTDAAAASSVLGESTLHAVLAQNATNITVEDCVIRNMQLKMAGEGGGDGCWVRRNRFEKPVNYAISFVAADSVTYPAPILNNCYIEENTITDSWSGGAIYLGPDGEVFSVEEMDNVHVLRNVVRGSVESFPGGEHFGVLLRLAKTSRDIRVCGNTVINDEGTYDGSYGIRVQSAAAGDDVDGLDVSDNYVDGADHAGIWIDVAGKNVRACNNTVRRCRGLYIIASQGDLHDPIISGNICDSTTIYGIRARAETGNIFGLSVSGNKVYDVTGSLAGPTGNAAYHYDAVVGYRIDAVSHGNIARNKTRTDMGYGAWMYGQGNVDVHFDGDWFYDLHTGFLRRAIGGGATDLAAGFATGSHNRGTGTVPTSRVVTARIADVSTASNATVKSPCAGLVEGVRGRLGGAITGANSAIVTAIEPASGGGFVNITDGGFTVAFNGSARGDVDYATPSAANAVERAGTLRATTDGASTGAQWEDVEFIIREDS